MKKVKIPAIHDNDLESLLKELNLWEKLSNRELTCHNCDEVITLENLAGLKVIDGLPNAICDNPECLAEESINTDENG